MRKLPSYILLAGFLTPAFVLGASPRAEAKSKNPKVLQVQTDTAITSRNYKFNYKGVKEIDGRQVHVFEAKPREKRVGLFKGKIYIDTLTGSLRRAEGQAVKSPSFFIKKIEFSTDYADFGAFTFPVHLHSTAKTRLVGRAVVDISTREYQPQAISVEAAGPAVLVPPPGVN